jgi:hypothetical protein
MGQERATGLREQVEAAVADQIRHLGPGGVDKAAVVRRFSGGGAGRSTLYRWIDAVIAHGAEGIKAIQALRAAVGKPSPPVDSNADPVTRAAALLPRTTDVVSHVGGFSSTIAIVELLQQTLGAAQQVMRHARTTDGEVRNAKLLLQAAEATRRGIETTMRMAESLREVAATDEFYAAVIAEIRQFDPQAAERLFHKLDKLTSQWGI